MSNYKNKRYFIYPQKYAILLSKQPVRQGNIQILIKNYKESEVDMIISNEAKQVKRTKETSTERAYRYIKEKTIHYEFYPGESINEVEIAKKLKVSRAPIREALNRLIGEGLVDFESRKGFYCRKLRLDEVANLYEVRADLELSAVIEACEEAPIEKVELLLSKCKDLEKSILNINIDNLVDLDEEFHTELVSLAGNIERLKFIKNINNRIRFVRQINLEAEDRRAKFIEEHTSILEAIYNRDIERSIDLMKKHLRVNSDQLKEDIREGLMRIYKDQIGLDY